MQIMNIKKTLKNLWWFLTANKTVNEFPDSIIILDEEGYVQRVNRKAGECFGISLNTNEEYEEDLIKIDSFIQDGMANVRKSIKSAHPVMVSAQIPGRTFYAELNAVKTNSGYCVSVRDLTKLTEEIINEEKIVRFNGEKNAMLYKIENDIKSPLTSISGFSQGLLDGLGGKLTEKQAKYIKIIRSNCDELYGFLDKFLEFSYVESSLYEPDYQNFDIVELFKTIAKEYDNEIKDKKLSFDIEYDSVEKRMIYSDFKAAGKIFRNILEVCLSSTESGYILVKLANPDEMTLIDARIIGEDLQKSYLQITIKDTGTGFADDEMKYLCDPYAQLEKSKKNFLRALKLGSASILTKRTNGYINIFSGVMNGTKYDIIIPVEKD